VSEFDPPERISTGSLAPYVLKSLVRKGSPLYKSWDPAGDRNLENSGDLSQYIAYCIGDLIQFLGGAAHNLQAKWRPVAQGGVLSTVVVGGLLHLWGKLKVRSGTPQVLDYKAVLAPLASFDFSTYTSSQWGKMSDEMLKIV
jgi:hypothetical protein